MPDPNQYPGMSPQEMMAGGATNNQPVTPAPLSPPTSVPNQTITAPNITPAMGQAIEDQEVNNKPISQQQFANSQIASLENRKYLTGEEANIKATGEDRATEINRKAAEEQDLITNGDPAKFKAAAADLLAAQARLKMAPLDKTGKPDQNSVDAAQSDINKARIGMQMNIGSKEAFAKAMSDAQQRDDALRKQIADAQHKGVDPDHWWETRSTGQKVSAGIGMVLGAVGQGLSRHGEGQNTAMGMIQGAINQDIGLQKDAINNNWKSISATHELDESSFNRDMHRQAWENNYRTASLEHVKLQLAAAAAQTGSQVVRQNALVGIQDATDAQNKIKLNQTLLAQQALQANAVRLRGLAKDFTGAVKDYAEKEGVNMEDAQRAVSGLPQFKPLMQAGSQYTPTVLLDDHAVQMKVGAAQEAVQKGMPEAEAMQKFGITPGDIQRYQTSVQNVGVLVPHHLQKPTPEEVLAERTGTQIDQNLKELSDYEKDVKTISPSLMQHVNWGEENQARTAKQQQYEAFVKRSVAEMIKAQTGGQEPKNPELVEQYARPYLPGHVYEDESVTAARMKLLRHDLQSATAGVTNAPVSNKQPQLPGQQSRGIQQYDLNGKPKGQ